MRDTLGIDPAQTHGCIETSPETIDADKIALLREAGFERISLGVQSVIGNVKDKIAIIVDDMADTCGTLVKAADTVMQHGAKEVNAIVVHGILSGKAIENLNGSRLNRLVVTNTVPHEEKKEACDKIETIDISPTLAEACRRTHNGESVSFLFSHAVA